MAELAAIALGLTAVSSVVGAGASIYSGIKANEAGQAQAKALLVKGKEEYAASQREALEARLQGKLLQSRQQAIAAASGGGAGVDAPSIVKLMSATGERTEYARKIAMHGGEIKKAYYTDAADSARRSGGNSLVGSILSAVGSLAGGFGTVGSQYGQFKAEGMLP